MSNPKEPCLSDHTFSSPEGISIKEFINDKSVKMTTNQALASADKATLKAESAVERRLEGLNELRGMALDQTRTFIPRAETEIINKSFSERLKRVEDNLIINTSRGGGITQGIGYIIAIVSFIITIIVFFLKF